MDSCTSKKAGRTIFIGDIHGCLDEFRELIALLKLEVDDRIILLGDLINRGPNSVGVVDYTAEQNFEAILGNHEWNYLHNVDTPKYHRLYEKLGPCLHKWLGSLPVYIEDKNFIAVHAGLQPYSKVSQTEPRILLNIRTWDGKGKNLSDLKNRPWYEYYEKENNPNIFYGHWARQGLNLRMKTFGLDSGCVYGGSLSAYILDTGQLFQVGAKKTYIQVG